MKDLKGDPLALKNSKIAAREFWTIHIGDTIKKNWRASNKIYFNYDYAKKDVIDLCFNNPDVSYYILKGIEIYRNVDGMLKAEIIEDLKQKI